MKAGWIKTTVGAAFATATGGTPPKSNSAFYGNYLPLVKPPELCDAELETAEDGLSEEGAGVARIAPPNSILVSCIGNLGKIGLNVVPVAFNQQINAILADASKAAPWFMFYQTLSCSFKKQLESLASGTTVPIVNKSKFNSVEIVLPPIAEQYRIVAILDEAFDGIATAKANAERNLQNARELVGIGFHAITENLGRAQWPIRQVAVLKAPHKGAMRTGPFGSQLLHSEFVDDGIAVLGIDNAVANEFRWDRRRYITKEKYQQMARYRVFPGDVLITIMGTCGRCAVVPENIPVAINTKHLCCITLDRQACLPEYLHIYFLHDLTARDYLTAQAKGSIMAGLNMGIISELPVRLPSIEIQAEIVEQFEAFRSECERLESTQRQKLIALDNLKKSLLHQAFTAQL